MIKPIELPAYDGYSRKFNMMEAEFCPTCHRGLRPVYIGGYVETDNRFSVLNYCTMCNNTFISKYTYIKPNPWPTYVSTNFVESLPKQIEVRIFEQELVDLSPRFCSIYNQSKCAEDMNLNEVAGMGYRKSLEFLIKDYSIFSNPESTTTITNTKYSLSQCIEDYITESHLKDLSKLTSWIGNDETHYTRKHIDKDIEDLKEYLDATIYFVLFNLKAKRAKSIIGQK